jgi:hypothetical protein
MQKRHGQLKEHSIGRPQGAPQTVPMETAERRNVEFAVEGLMQRGMSAGLLSNSIPKKAIGIWWVITRQFFLFGIP